LQPIDIFESRSSECRRAGNLDRLTVGRDGLATSTPSAQPVAVLFGETKPVVGEAADIGVRCGQSATQLETLEVRVVGWIRHAEVILHLRKVEQRDERSRSVPDIIGLSSQGLEAARQGPSVEEEVVACVLAPYSSEEYSYVIEGSAQPALVCDILGILVR